MDAGDVATWPGEARDKTSLDRGSVPTLKTIGIVAVAALAIVVMRVLLGVAMTATRRRTMSAISAGSRSNRPSSQWYSTVTFRSST
jgi:hypothetical protein